MRRMSFMLTERQFCDGSKDVTRRDGWYSIKPGERFVAVHKAMGLKKGERQRVLGVCEVVSARLERLDAITQDDCRREGFPDMTPAEFVAMFGEHMFCGPAHEVMRIEFRRVAP